MPLTTYGKRQIAHAMFHKGKNFIHAAVLLDRNDGYHDVVFHLLAQGLEIIQKGLLLAKDFDKYEPLLAKRDFGHKLIKGSDELAAAYGFKSTKESLRKELEQLSSLFAAHTLRYGTIGDLLGNPSDIRVKLVWRRVGTLMKIGNKIFQN